MLRNTKSSMRKQLPRTNIYRVSIITIFSLVIHGRTSQTVRFSVSRNQAPRKGFWKDAYPELPDGVNLRCAQPYITTYRNVYSPRKPQSKLLSGWLKRWNSGFSANPFNLAVALVMNGPWCLGLALRTV